MSQEEHIRRSLDNRPWYVVATAPGEAVAAIIAGRLKTAGIPVWIYRESAGAAIGLSVGPLGTVEVLVPEDYYEEALALLEADDAPLLDDGAPPLDDGETIDMP